MGSSLEEVYINRLYYFSATQFDALGWFYLFIWKRIIWCCGYVTLPPQPWVFIFPFECCRRLTWSLLVCGIKSSSKNLWPNIPLDEIRIRACQSCNCLHSQLLIIYYFVKNTYIGLSKFHFLIQWIRKFSAQDVVFPKWKSLFFFFWILLKKRIHIKIWLFPLSASQVISFEKSEQNQKYYRPDCTNLKKNK